VAGQQLAAFEQGLIQEAEEALRAAEAAYRLGERGILEVLDAQRVLRTVRLDLLNAQYDRQAALVDLDEVEAADPRSQNP
jgi:cobalt-zinc-cadmium efflux system outer membrane protein